MCMKQNCTHSFFQLISGATRMILLIAGKLCGVSIDRHGADWCSGPAGHTISNSGRSICVVPGRRFQAIQMPQASRTKGIRIQTNALVHSCCLEYRNPDPDYYARTFIGCLEYWTLEWDSARSNTSQSFWIANPVESEERVPYIIDTNPDDWSQTSFGWSPP